MNFLEKQFCISNLRKRIYYWLRSTDTMDPLLYKVLHFNEEINNFNRRWQALTAEQKLEKEDHFPKCFVFTEGLNPIFFRCECERMLSEARFISEKFESIIDLLKAINVPPHSIM